MSFSSSRLSIINRQSSFINHKGFTLIELLVVISVIALLMAILMPCLQRVRKQARAIACQSKLRQWGLLYAAYVADNHGDLPAPKLPPGKDIMPSWDRYWGPDPSGPMSTRRFRENGTEHLLLCPMAAKLAYSLYGEGGGGTFLAWGHPPEQPDGWYGSYGENMACQLVKQLTPANEKIQWRRSDVKDAAIVPVLLDAFGPLGAVGNQEKGETTVTCDAIPTALIARRNAPFLINRHDGGTNALFMDWSVRKVGLKEQWVIKWSPMYNTHGPWTKAGGIKPEDWPEWMRGFRDY